MNKRTATVRLGTFLALAFISSTSSAHHNATHDQNPSPPAPLGATSILHFNTGSIVIPFDGCYARTSALANADVDAIVTPLTASSAKCNGTTEKDDGMIRGYSLAFRLIKDGIPVNWAIKSGKSGWNSIDFSIVKASKSPVYWRAPGKALNTTKYATITTVSYRGAPFVIDAAYAADAITLMNTYASAHSEYGEVDYHIAQSGFDAPIYKTLTALPKLAVLNINDAATNLHAPGTANLQDVIDDALIADLEGDLWDWVTIPEVNAGDLAAYDLAWVPTFDLDQPGMPTAAQIAFIGKLADFADGGGSLLFQDAAVASVEGWGSMSGATYVQSATKVQNFMVDSGGLIPNGVSGSWDNGSATETTYSGDYSDPASQFGGDHWTGIGGSKYNWKPRYDKTYLPGVRRMIYTQHATDSKKRWDIATWRKKDNDATKGTIYYLGGENWRKNTVSGFRIVMNTILTTQLLDHTNTLEVARSSPVIALVDGTETEYAGTFDEILPPQSGPTYTSAGDASLFEFPFTTGHFRGIDVSLLADGETEFDDASSAVLFDANDHIPAINYTGSGCGGFPIEDDAACRRIFTDVGADDDPSVLMVVTANHDALMPMYETDTIANTDLLIARTHAGIKDGTGYIAQLGGVDRATPAVIESSPLTGTTRPTIAYVGGRDGMLHAICAEAVGECPAAGVELWAFLPSTEIDKVRLNSTRIDGSPKVADVYGSFHGAARSLKTVLTFQTGNQLASATYALDVTDPANPDVLWRLDTAGPGVNVAMGWVRDLAAIKSFTFVQSAYDPSGTVAGFELRAVETDTGDVRWTWSFPYLAPRDPDNPNVPLTSVPGGVTLVAGDGATTHSVLVPTLYGRVFRVDPLSGENFYGDQPLFDFGEDFHPIGTAVTLYRDDSGVLHGLIASGGFVDPFSPSGTEWAPDDVHQYAVGFPILTEDVPVTRAQVALDDSLGVYIDFGAGQRAFSSAIIAGGELFVTTDTTNVNAADYEETTDPTGTLWSKELDGSGTATAVVVRSGAASPDVSLSTGTVISGGRNSVTVTRPSGFDPSGATTEAQPTSSSGRQLWLRLR
jgi:hypothetical protein